MRGKVSDRIYEIAKYSYGMDMVSGPLRLKSAAVEGGVWMAENYEREIEHKVAR